MIPALLVKADVVDIRNRKSNLPKRVVADANVLYVINYDCTGLATSGGRVPPSYQTWHYPAWWKRAAQAGVELCTAASCLAEFAHIVERTELENLWRTDPNRPELDPNRPGQDFTPKYTKIVRYHYHGQVKPIREGVETTLASTRKNVNILPRVGQDEAALNRAIQMWVESAADFADANLVATAKSAGIANILSDDADLISFEGIIVYTANQTAIGAAQASGKLIP
jgi:predicted nucleic acid-binding protein